METVVPKQNTLRLKLNRYLPPSLFVTTDFLAVCLAVWIALFLRKNILSFFALETSPIVLPETAFYLALPTFYVSSIACADLYQRRLQLYQWAQSFFKITSCVCAAVIIAAYLMGMAEAVPRLFVALFWLISFLGLCGMRYFAKRLLLLVGIWQRPVVIVGAGKTAELLADTFEKDNGVGYKICLLYTSRCV